MSDPIEVDHRVPMRANEAKQAPKAKSTVPQPVVPLEVKDVGVTTNALKTLADRAAARLREVGDARVPVPEKRGEMVHYLACGCAKDMPACVFVKKPDLSQNRIESNQWFASYKPVEAEWDEGREPLCQVCYAETVPGKNGKPQPKKVTCRLRQRFVRSCPTDEFEDKMLPRELRKTEGVSSNG